MEFLTAFAFLLIFALVVLGVVLFHKLYFEIVKNLDSSFWRVVALGLLLIGDFFFFKEGLHILLKIIGA